MAVIKIEDVIAFYVGDQRDQLVCADCATEDEIANTKKHDVISERDEYLFYCDRCEDKI